MPKKTLLSILFYFLIISLVSLFFWFLLGLKVRAQQFKPFGSDPNLIQNSIVITEINWAGSSASSSDEWIELYNTTDIDINLDNLEITGLGSSTDSIFLGIEKCNNLIIKAKSYFLMANYTADSPNSLLNFEPDCVTSSISLVNSGENISLKYDNVVIDAISALA